MKKVLILILLIIGIFTTFNREVVSWVNSNFSSNPMPYYQQRIEFFEKLSKEYYGTAEYCKELEMVNRSYNLTDLSTDRSELIVPSLDAIVRLKERQTIAALENDPRSRILKSNSQTVIEAAEGEKLSAIDKIVF